MIRGASPEILRLEDEISKSEEVRKALKYFDVDPSGLLLRQ